MGGSGERWFRAEERDAENRRSVDVTVVHVGVVRVGDGSAVGLSKFDVPP